MRLVYIPCRFDELTGPYLIESALGWVEEVTRARVELVDQRFCIVGELFGGDATGRFRVRFKDGTNVEVYPCREWRFIPDGSDPYTVEDLVQVATCA